MQHPRSVRQLVCTVTEIIPERLRDLISALPGCRLADKVCQCRSRRPREKPVQTGERREDRAEAEPSTIVELDLRHCKPARRTLPEIESQNVPKDPAAELPGERAQAIVGECIGPGFKVICRKVAKMPRTARGKFLMHEPLV
jgi:hypothetical protein